MCKCGAQWIGTSWRSTVEATDGPVPGHCDNCEAVRLEQIKKGEEMMRAGMRRVAGESPDLELPDTSPELAEQLGFHEEEERERFP